RRGAPSGGGKSQGRRRGQGGGRRESCRRSRTDVHTATAITRGCAQTAGGTEGVRGAVWVARRVHRRPQSPSVNRAASKVDAGLRTAFSDGACRSTRSGVPRSLFTAGPVVCSFARS